MPARLFSLRAALFFACAISFATLGVAPAAAATILVYHRFGPVIRDSMTVTTPIFREQIDWLASHHYRIVPLRALIAGLKGEASRPRSTDVAVTIDDGHQTVFTEIFPLLKRDKMPVTLFIYPSAISNASYAMTWAQLSEMAQSGFVDVQSHTYWHPNFKTEAKRLDMNAYDKFVTMQLTRPKEVLTARLGARVDLLSWPFGIHDADLEQRAARAGYIAAFTLERHPVHPGDNLFALPRYLITDYDRGARFGAIFEKIGSEQ